MNALIPSIEPGKDAGQRVLSVGIIGAGEIVSRIHLPVLSNCEGVDIAYVADKSAEAADSVAGSYKIAPVCVGNDLEQIPRTDVVLLALPVAARLPYYELFSKRRTVVLAEKPLALSATDGERICNLYPEHGLACGFQRRSYASVALAKLVVAENWFGPLVSMSVSEGALTTKTGTDFRFYDDAGSGGGVLMDLGCHSLDAAMYIAGATEAIPTQHRFVFDNGIDREVEARFTLTTAKGSCELDYFVSWLRPADNLIELQFQNCAVSLSCQPNHALEIRNGKNKNVGMAPLLTAKEAGASTVYQAFYLEWMAFLDGVRKQQPSKFNARSCLPTIRAVDALYRAGKRNA
jgi:predicted dehydrogenase